MSFAKNVWNQLKNTTVERLIKALEKDGWNRDIEASGGVLVFLKGTERVTIHYHPKKTYGANLLKGLIADIGWDEDDLKRLKLVKK